MKKTKILLLLIAIPLILVGCGEGDVGSPQNDTSDSQVLIDQNKYEDSLNGLESYLKDMDLISGQSTQMLSEVINAKSGVKYTFKYNNSNVTVELYEFENVNEDVVNQVSTKGTLSIFDKEIPATVSDNGRFLLIYSDKSNNKQNIEKSEKTKEAVKNFKK